MTPLAPPGWYPDPGANAQRYFDGTKWTDHFAPFNPPSGPGPLPPPKSQRKLKRGAITGLFVALGLFLGMMQSRYHGAGPGLYSDYIIRILEWMGSFFTVVGIINVVAAIVLARK